MKITNSTQDRKWVIVLMAALFVVLAQGGTVVSGGATTGGGGGGFSVSGVGFSMSGGGGTSLQYEPCLAGTCIAPGSYGFSDSISSEETPGGMSGIYSVNGVSYNYYCNQGTACGGGIDFSGVLILPDFGSSGPATITVTAPFASTGGIGGVATILGQPAPSLFFQGVGNATITLRELSPDVYVFSSATYVFVATPEPATMSLVGLALLFLGYRRARR
jgi:hypothetical protein